MITKIIIAVMIVCLVLMILGFVAISKWSDEAMDRILENDKKDNSTIRKFDNSTIK